MTGSQNQPREFDAIRGGDVPPSLGAVLGGVEGVKQRLASSDIETRVTALSRALSYGDAGLNLVIKALDDNSAKVRKVAVRLLKDIDNSQVKAALNEYKFWTIFEKYYEIPDNHATTFANRKVIEFDPDIGITETVDTAYALRVVPGEGDYINSVMPSVDKLQLLLQSYFANQVEALVFGFWYTTYFEYHNFCPIIDTLLGASEKLTNLKALFLGDINNAEWGNIHLAYANLSYLLLAYPQLEILKIRTSYYDKSYNQAFGLEFSPIIHTKLKALTIEGCNISSDIVEEIFKLELPNLEYLELWFGTDRCDIYGYMHKFHIAFPKLKYLGLRKYYHIDPGNIAFTIKDSLKIENLIELDLSMGQIQDDGAKALLNCSKLHQLDTLNISYNCLTNEMVEELNKLDIEVIADKQDPYRYWSAYE